MQPIKNQFRVNLINNILPIKNQFRVNLIRNKKNLLNNNNQLMEF